MRSLNRSRQTKVLGQDVFGCVRDPVIDHEGRAACIEVAVVKDEKVFVLLSKALQGVWFTLGEVPDVAFVEGSDLIATVLVDRRERKLTSIQVTPFRLQLCQQTHQQTWKDL